MDTDHDIYILLTNTGSVLTRLIKWYTGDPLNHASLVFDVQLKEIYSFGRKSPGNPFIGGFVEEDLQGRLFGGASCALYRCTVSTLVYEQMRKRVEQMLNEKQRYKYNLLGLFGVMLNLKLERQYAYFCSQFVASVFEENGINLTGKPSALVTPGDLAQSPSLRLIYRGEVSDLLHSSAFQMNKALSA